MAETTSSLTDAIGLQRLLQGGNSYSTMQGMLNQPNREQTTGQGLQKAAQDIKADSFGGGLAKGLLTGAGLAQERKGATKKERMQEYLMAQQEYEITRQRQLDEQLQELNNLKMASAARESVQQNIDLGLDAYQSTGDLGMLNETLNLEQAKPFKALFERQITDQGGVFQGLTATPEGDLMPFGTTPDGSRVYGQAIPVEQGYSQQYLAAKQADQLARDKAQLDIEAQQANIAKTEAETLKAQAEAANPMGKAPSGYRYAADGNLEAIPGGPGDKPTEGQSNAALYASRMMNSDAVINDLVNRGYRPTVGQDTVASVPGGNFLLSGDTEQYQQAQRDFINAVLRRESGAVISDAEFDNARKQYFPQPGDNPDTIAQKAQNRVTAIQGITKAAGPAGRDLQPTYGKGGKALEGNQTAEQIRAAYQAGQITREQARAQLQALGGK